MNYCGHSTSRQGYPCGVRRIVVLLAAVLVFAGCADEPDTYQGQLGGTFAPAD
jgi:uncharacterized lipoprotein YajG